MRRERLYRTEGIVLRQRDFGEADRILVLLTPGGKRSILAKGIRRPTSRKVGHLGLFYRAQLMLARGRDLDIVSQAESLEEFEGIRADLLRFTYACYAGELMDRFAPEDEEGAPFYELMVQALRWFASEQDLRLWMRYFELRLLSHGGYRPELFACLSCREEIRAVPNYFSNDRGGVLCTRCGQGVPGTRSISVNSQKVLRYLLTRDAPEVRTLHLQPATQTEVEAVMQSYLEHVLERELKSATFLRRLRRELHTIESGDRLDPESPLEG